MKTTEKNTSRMETPQNYEAPVVSRLEVVVEKGFALSGDDSPDAPMIPDPWR